MSVGLATLRIARDPVTAHYTGMSHRHVTGPVRDHA
jgi:hypothetical protein